MGTIRWLLLHGALARDLWEYADVQLFSPDAAPDVLKDNACIARTCYLQRSTHHAHEPKFCSCACADVNLASSPELRPSFPENASKMMPPRWPSRNKSCRRRRKVGPKCSRYMRMVDSVFIKWLSETLAKTHKRPRGNMAARERAKTKPRTHGHGASTYIYIHVAPCVCSMRGRTAKVSPCGFHLSLSLQGGSSRHRSSIGRLFLLATRHHLPVPARHPRKRPLSLQKQKQICMHTHVCMICHTLGQPSKAYNS